MGIFSIFSKNSEAPRTDRVWMTSATKLKGCMDYLKENRPDLCIAWFEDTYKMFNRYLNEENNMNIEIRMAAPMHTHQLENRRVVFLEHYPLYKKEAHLLSEKNAAGICFMNALDNTIFQLFGGNIEKMMRGMGVEENDYIESGLVSKSIISAQKRLEKNVPNDFYARSGSEWLQNYSLQYRKR